jgi:hypothetical protein
MICCIALVEIVEEFVEAIAGIFSKADTVGAGGDAGGESCYRASSLFFIWDGIIRYSSC